MSKNESRLLRITEAARLLKVPIKTLRRWTDQGFIKAIRINPKGNRYYRREDIIRPLKTLRKGGKHD